jgi:hypothetical protein
MVTSTNNSKDWLSIFFVPKSRIFLLRAFLNNNFVYSGHDATKSAAILYHDSRDGRGRSSYKTFQASNKLSIATNIASIVFETKQSDKSLLIDRLNVFFPLPDAVITHAVSNASKLKQEAQHTQVWIHIKISKLFLN